MILYEETVSQSSSDNTNFVDLLRKRGIHAGIKLDKGLVVIGGTKGENSTSGLDGLAARAKIFYEKGCRFAKWRAVIKIGDEIPSELAITETAHTLARYASICQDNGLVPIIEPEILQDGDHTIEVCAEVSERVFAAVIKAMQDHKLILEGTLIKPNMVTPGATCPDRKSPEEIAWFTIRTFSRTIVPAVPGITLLSGGLSEEEASQNLNAINQVQGIQKPWVITFSYGRALQQSVLKAW